MGGKAPGRSECKGISLIEAVQQFGDDAAAEAWFVQRRWPDGIHCLYCDGDNVRSLDTADQMILMAQGAIGKRLPWRELVANSPSV